MAGDLQQRLDSIKHKAEIITQRYKNLLEQNNAAQQRIDQLQNTVRMQQKQLQDAMLKIEHLEIATTLSPGRQNVEQTRVILSELVRNIDKCINDLKQ